MRLLAVGFRSLLMSMSLHGYFKMWNCACASLCVRERWGRGERERGEEGEREGDFEYLQKMREY